MQNSTEVDLSKVLVARGEAAVEELRGLISCRVGGGRRGPVRLHYPGNGIEAAFGEGERWGIVSFARVRRAAEIAWVFVVVEGRLL